ncbi:uncharacterized protein LOC129592488 [Paramacrobiotus metropolitanus]|uniref:uncharacterized protein LOC129592488 n=1 Tax=Paramacrobiotus metropolitanus TaxID=2943436 RepID=UPI002445CA7F|nr:uncharacterized protein LOC129592488 [Paramacrobiotus metropolitanus]XP_055344509.1 uncharacterized protein LOC129592488 [Paramacrobiotus metropolitanus]
MDAVPVVVARRPLDSLSGHIHHDRAADHVDASEALLLHPSSDHIDTVEHSVLADAGGLSPEDPSQYFNYACAKVSTTASGPSSLHTEAVCIEMGPLPAQPHPRGVGVKALGWLTCPVALVEENAPLPAISVFADADATDELELVVHTNGEGTAQVGGPRVVSLRSQGALKPSVASFEGVCIKRAGLYVVEVRCVRQPEISLVADHPTEVVTRIDTHSPLDDVGVPEEMGLAGRVHMWGGG